MTIERTEPTRLRSVSQGRTTDDTLRTSLPPNGERTPVLLPEPFAVNAYDDVFTSLAAIAMKTRHEQRVTSDQERRDAMKQIDEESAQKSIALMNGKALRGRPLRVNEAENRPPRPAGAGGPPSYRPPFRGGVEPPPPAEFSEFGRKGDARSRRGRSQKNQGPRKSEQPPRRTERRRHRNFDDEDY